MAPLDISAIAKNLIRRSDGIWSGRQSSSPVSYPEKGNEACLALENDSFWFVHRNRVLQSLMRQYPPPGTLFDVGGGNGYVAAALQQMGIPVALVEPGWEGIQNARQRQIDTLIWSTLEDAEFSLETLPAVSMFDVIEHIDQDVRFLQMVYDLLIPDGRLYLTVPAYQSLWSVDDDYAGHFRRYTLPSLIRTLEQIGFCIDYGSYFFWPLPVPIWFGRTLPSRLGLRHAEAWDRYQNEHHQRSGVFGGLLETALGWELHRIQQDKIIPFGASIVLAARKDSQETV